MDKATDRAAVVAIAEGCGWTVVGSNANGYLKLLCGCGVHIKWVHKTPSNPRYWQQCANKIQRLCCPDADAGHPD